MSDSDRRERPWKVLRVLVEVTVPPTSRLTEKDLSKAVDGELGGSLVLPFHGHDRARSFPARVKTWGRWWPVFRITEKRAGRL